MEESKETQSLMRRYTDSYRVARVTVGFGSFIKFIGVVLAILIAAGGILVANQSRIRSEAMTGIEGGIQAQYMTLGIGSVILAGIVGVFFYIWGVLISAQGQILKASLDGAVNSSPFLTNEPCHTPNFLRLRASVWQPLYLPNFGALRKEDVS